MLNRLNLNVFNYRLREAGISVNSFLNVFRMVALLTIPRQFNFEIQADFGPYLAINCRALTTTNAMVITIITATAVQATTL